MREEKMKFDAGQRTSFALGRQLTIEYYDCGADLLLEVSSIENALLKAAEDSGATIISSSFHQFEPQGVSGVVIIAESHFTIHAWPEHDYAAVDIFTCGDSIDLELAIDSMKASFGAGNVVVSSDQNRGIIARPLEQKKTGEIAQNSKIHPISWKKEFERKNPRGVSTSVDVYGIDPRVIGDAGCIETFGYELCDLIGMKPAGKCRVVHSTEDETSDGFSMTLGNGTSTISGVFAVAAHTLYLDVFYCKFYEPRKIAEFTLSFFKGDHYKMQIALRH
jgi:S-adenosylmethionine decarboxylase